LTQYALRIYGAGFVLGATVTAAVWVYTYRVWRVNEYIDRTGVRFHASDCVRTQPWWSVPATVVLLLIGAISVWLLPDHRRLIRRVASRFAGVAETG
jgi:hypothetical protein